MKREEILNIVGGEEDLNKYLDYLDNLRKSGVTNMFGASVYICSAFSISKEKSDKILMYWMETFGERNE